MNSVIKDGADTKKAVSGWTETVATKRGCLLGLAVGDALGKSIEFRERGSFEPVTGFREGGPYPIGAGDWTDDTSMALALADSIGRVGWDVSDQTERYLSWWRDGEYSVIGDCFDIGGTTATGLSRFESDGDAMRSGPTDSLSSGNGSIMRLAPVAIAGASMFPNDIVGLARLAAESSRPTHGSAQCLSACQFLGVVLAALINGVSREEVLSPQWEPLQQLRRDVGLHPKIDAVANGSYRQKSVDQIRGSGWVVESLEAALWAFDGASCFRDAVLRAVNLGDDADTTGAVCGQLAGACWGQEGIPIEWLEELGQREEMIEPILDRLVKVDLAAIHKGV